MCVCRLLAITDVMLMSYGCRAAACSSVRFALRPSIAPLFDTDGGEGNGGEVVVACFFRISTVCRSR